MGSSGTSPQGSSSEQATPKPRPGAPRLLVAGSDPEARARIGFVLRSAGYEVHEARDETSFFAHVERSLLGGAFDGIVLGARSEDLDTLRALAAFRSAGWSVPLFVAGQLDEATATAALHAGAINPEDAETLFRALDRLERRS